MASTWYPKFKEALLTGAANSNPSTATVKAILIDSADYTYSATHQYLSDVPSAARVAISPALANKTFTNGVFDADDTTFAAVTGDTSETLIVFIDTGTEATSRLVVYVDTFSAGMPVTPNGGSINVAFDNGTNKIAAL
jgi:hypothetical protein